MGSSSDDEILSGKYEVLNMALEEENHEVTNNPFHLRSYETGLGSNYTWSENSNFLKEVASSFMYCKDNHNVGSVVESLQIELEIANCTIAYLGDDNRLFVEAVSRLEAKNKNLVERVASLESENKKLKHNESVERVPHLESEIEELTERVTGLSK